LESIAIIPARGGSKRLPRKNILNFMGHPIISYTINAAIESQYFSRVVVSTEDREIAEVAQEYGAKVMMRPLELAQDTSRVIDVCMHVIEQESKQERHYTSMCCLYATAPLRNSEDILATMKILQPDICDFSMAVTSYYFPPHQALKEEKNGILQPLLPDMAHMQSQAVGKIVVDNGSTYGVNIEKFLKEKTFYGTNLKGNFMPRSRSVDIDELEDFELAEIFAKNKKLNL